MLIMSTKVKATKPKVTKDQRMLEESGKSITGHGVLISTLVSFSPRSDICKLFISLSLTFLYYKNENTNF